MNIVSGCRSILVMLVPYKLELLFKFNIQNVRYRMLCFFCVVMLDDDRDDCYTVNHTGNTDVITALH